MRVDFETTTSRPSCVSREGSAHRRLRAATRDEHAAAESVAVLTALAEGRIDEMRYTAMLTALAALFDAWEHENRVFLDTRARFGWSYASRACLIERDLRALGVATGTRTQDRVAADAIAPAVAPAPAFAWGMLYVVEGSALGGRVLAARVRTALPHCAATHYLQVGAADAGRWPRFCALLDDALDTESDIERAIAGARTLFDRYRIALEDI